MCWREVSLKIRRRFPTVEHLRECGLMTDEEYAFYTVHQRVHVCYCQ